MGVNICDRTLNNNTTIKSRTKVNDLETHEPHGLIRLLRSKESQYKMLCCCGTTAEDEEENAKRSTYSIYSYFSLNLFKS